MVTQLIVLYLNLYLKISKKIGKSADCMSLKILLDTSKYLYIHRICIFSCDAIFILRTNVIIIYLNVVLFESVGELNSYVKTNTFSNSIQTTIWSDKGCNSE